MTVLGFLVYLLLAYDAFCIAVWSPSVLFGEELVLVDLAATAFSGVACTCFPLVWYYHLR